MFNPYLTEGVTTSEARETVLAYLRQLWKEYKEQRPVLEALANKATEYKPLSTYFGNIGLNGIAYDADKLCTPEEYEEWENACIEAAEDWAENGAERMALSRAYSM